jgi:hypothetical protein
VHRSELEEDANLIARLGMQQEDGISCGLSVYVVSVSCFLILMDLGNSCLG